MASEMALVKNVETSYKNIFKMKYQRKKTISLWWCFLIGKSNSEGRLMITNLRNKVRIHGGNRNQTESFEFKRDKRKSSKLF